MFYRATQKLPLGNTFRPEKTPGYYVWAGRYERMNTPYYTYQVRSTYQKHLDSMYGLDGMNTPFHT